jgi:hypothetical protein
MFAFLKKRGSEPATFVHLTSKQRFLFCARIQAILHHVTPTWVRAQNGTYGQGYGVAAATGRFFPIAERKGPSRPISDNTGSNVPVTWSIGNLRDSSGVLLNWATFMPQRDLVPAGKTETIQVTNVRCQTDTFLASLTYTGGGTITISDQMTELIQ